tara:strand:- start:1285 stop:1545 length:261 start_codon:yes stop_codon:yes gene_type:complete
MKKTTLFEKAFKKVLKKKKTAEEDDNTVGGGALGPAAAIGHNGLTNTDWYAPGDNRRPKALGAVYSRRGKVGKSKNKKTRKTKKKK